VHTKNTPLGAVIYWNDSDLFVMNRFFLVMNYNYCKCRTLPVTRTDQAHLVLKMISPASCPTYRSYHHVSLPCKLLHNLFPCDLPCQNLFGLQMRSPPRSALTTPRHPGCALAIEAVQGLPPSRIATDCTPPRRGKVRWPSSFLPFSSSSYNSYFGLNDIVSP
jgi:hypothetical protein